MAKDEIIRPALGRDIQVGAFYEISKGQFLSGNAVTGDQRAMKMQSIDSFSVNSFAIPQKTERFKALDISADEALNISTNFVKFDGCGMYLKQPFSSAKYIEHVIVMEMTEERFFDEALCERISLKNVPPGATHLVTGIEWGARVCLVIMHSTENISDKINLSKHLEEISKEIANALRKAVEEEKETVDCSGIETLLGETRPELKLFSDVNPSDYCGSSIREAVEEMWRIHQNVLRVNGYLGRPINYILTGIKEFSTAFSVDQHYIHECQEISKKLAEKLLFAIDQLTNVEGRIEELRDSSMLPIDVQEEVNAFLEECDEVRNKFYTSVRENLPKARLCDEDARDELLVTYGRLQDCSISEKKLQKFLEKYPIIEREKWLSTHLKSSKIPVYIMTDVEEAIRSSNNQIFVLFFSISDVPNEDNWKRMVETFVTAGKENDVRLFAVHVDSGLAETNTIVVWKDKKQLTNDYFGDMERTRAMNMAFPQSKFNQNKSDFTTTVYAEFPCPKKDCRGGKSLDWTCSQCVKSVIYESNLWTLCYLVVIVAIVIAFRMWPDETSISSEPSSAVLKISMNIEKEIVALKDKYPQMTERTEATLKRSLNKWYEKDEPKPIVITFAGATGVAKNFIADLIQLAMKGIGQQKEINLTPEHTREELLEHIRSELVNKEKTILALQNIDQMTKDAPMIFYNYADTESYAINNLLLLLTINSDIPISQCDAEIRQLLTDKWITNKGTKYIDPILSRILTITICL